MIKVFKHSEINVEKWNECIHLSPNKNIYANTWFLDVVCPQWEALVYGDYEAVMPLTSNKKFGFSYLYQPYFTQQLGVFGIGNITSEIVNEFLLAIPNEYRFIEINLNIHNTLQNQSFEIKNLPTHLLNLNQKYEDIAAKYSDNMKRNLAKTNKNPILKLQKQVNVDELITLFRNNKGKEIHNIKDIHYNIFKKLTSGIVTHAQLNSWGVIDDKNKLLAAAIFPQYNNQVVFLFSGVSNEGRDVAAMPFLIDSFIKQHAEQNILFDFEGSKDPNLARFYKGFGAVEYLYPQIRRNNLPIPLKWLK